MVRTLDAVRAGDVVMMSGMRAFIVDSLSTLDDGRTAVRTTDGTLIIDAASARVIID